MGYYVITLAHILAYDVCTIAWSYFNLYPLRYSEWMEMGRVGQLGEHPGSGTKIDILMRVGSE